MPLEKTQPEQDPEDAKICRLQDLVGYHLRRASVFDLQGAVSALEPANTRPVPMSVLLSIIETPGISSAEICRALGMQRANIVPILAELEERGLFLREADESDQRIDRGVRRTFEGYNNRHAGLQFWPIRTILVLQ